MTEQKRAFLIDLKEVLEKHKVDIMAVDSKENRGYGESYGEPAFDINIQDSEGFDGLGYLCPESIYELLTENL